MPLQLPISTTIVDLGESVKLGAMPGGGGTVPTPAHRDATTMEASSPRVRWCLFGEESGCGAKNTTNTGHEKWFTNQGSMKAKLGMDWIGESDGGLPGDIGCGYYGAGGMARLYGLLSATLCG